MNILSTMFNTVFNMTRLGVVLFLVILIGRYMLYKSPKIYSYLLWAGLFLRLIIPINIYSDLSLIKLKYFNKPINTDIVKHLENNKIREYISNNLNIEAFNLNKYFIDFYCSENFNFIPKYEIFECIKKKYQGDFIVIGDRFVDIELAKRYNLFSIGCGYGYGNYNELKDADYIIDNFKDIISIIEI